MASRVTGQAKLRVVEARLLKLPADLSQRVERELQRVAPKVSEAIRAEVPSHIPRRGGYAATLFHALRFKWVAKAGKGMTGQVWADGKKENRDLPKLNRLGMLRHMTFGRRADKWHDQTAGVRKGFINDGVDVAEPLIVKAVEKAGDQAADNIVR